MTLLQSIDDLLKKITITDKQTLTVSTTYKNIKALLLAADSKLNGLRVFQNGSYDRDTIIAPLDDVDIFFVLDRQKYLGESGLLVSPQRILTKVKDFLNATKDYKGKVKQDRPCVTIHLYDKMFDVLPCFGNKEDGYLIPNQRLDGWIKSNPETHSDRLTAVNKKRDGLIVPLCRIIKYWNRENNKVIPSFHIEEMAIDIFNTWECKNYEEAVYHWFDKSQIYLNYNIFQSDEDWQDASDNVIAASGKIGEAHRLYEEEKEKEAQKIWKEVFGRKFPTVSEEEAKALNEQMKNGQLRMATNGYLSTASTGILVPSTKFYGDKSE